MQVAQNLEFDFHVVYPNVRYSRFVRYSRHSSCSLVYASFKDRFSILDFVLHL